MCMLSTPLYVARYPYCRDKKGEVSTLGSQNAYKMALVSAEYVAPGRLQSGYTDNRMPCALGSLNTCPKIQPRSTGWGPIGLVRWLTSSVSILARGSLAFEVCASPGMRNGGVLSRQPSMGFYLAYSKLYYTMLSWGMKRVTS
jgi:hypothetical protein